MVDNVQFLGEYNGFPCKDYHILSSEGPRHVIAVLSRTILNILFDRQGPNTGFLILRTFEHFKFKDIVQSFACFMNVSSYEMFRFWFLIGCGQIPVCPSMSTLS